MKLMKFELDTLFEVVLPNGDLKEKTEPAGAIPLVSAGKFGNGIVKLILQTDSSNLFDAGCITVDMFGKAFYQDTSFYCVTHGRVNVLKPRKPLELHAGLYVVAAIDRCLRGKYSFSKMCVSTKLRKESVFLPTTKDGLPDFTAMAQYMRNLPYAELVPLPKAS